MRRAFLSLLGVLIAFLFVMPVTAGEIKIGEPKEINGMAIAAVYLQAVMMDPREKTKGVPDIHLEADIHAVEGNPYGFGERDWFPYLEISYRIEKVGTEWSTSGSLVPMTANDGPHYGDNVALDGPGEYELTYDIIAPVRHGFYRHTDKETGVPEWWAPFQVTWTFKYIGVGKKGGY
jgi:uncharacterized protein involved in high-affinity Fe2+ transport